MTHYFVKSGGSNLNAGTSFDDGWATLTYAFDTVSAGDIIFNSHTLKTKDGVGGSRTFSGPGTASQPVFVISVDITSADTSGTDGFAFTYTPGATSQSGGEFTTGYVKSNTNGLTMRGDWFFRGVNFGAEFANIVIGNANDTFIGEDMAIGSDRDDIADGSTSVSLILRNCLLFFGRSTCYIDWTGGGRFEMYGGGDHPDMYRTSVPTYLFNSLATRAGDIHMEAVDWSGLPASHDMMGALSTAGPIRALWNGCHFPDLPAFDTYTPVSASDTVAVHPAAWDVDAAMLEYNTHSTVGDTFESITTYLDGEHDGTTPYSIILTAVTRDITDPDRNYAASVELQELWLDGDETLTIRINCSVELDDDEFWITVHGPSSAQGGKRVVQSSRVNFPDGAVIATDGVSSWTAGQTYSQVVSMTLSGFQAGSFTIMAHSRYTGSDPQDIYIDPEPGIA